MSPTASKITDDPSENTDDPSNDVEANDAEKAFRPSPAWILLGLLAIALGVGCGFVMSSATFLR